MRGRMQGGVVLETLSHEDELMSECAKRETESCQRFSRLSTKKAFFFDSLHTVVVLYVMLCVCFFL